MSTFTGSLPVYYPESFIGNAIHLYKAAYDFVCIRMKNNNMYTQNITDDCITKIFRTLIASELQSTEVCSELFKILTNNLVISDEILMKRLKLSLYNPNRQLTHWYYIRSWTFSSLDFEKIMNDFTLDGTYGSIIELWCAQLLAETPLENVYIRYIGQTSNPQNRGISNDEIYKTNGFMANFFKKAELLGVKASSYKAMVFEQESIAITTKDYIDTFEQIIVNLFGLDSLLNSQPGGLNQIYTPSEPDRQDYLAAKPMFFTKLKGYTNPYSKPAISTANPIRYLEAQEKLKPWIQSIQRLHQQLTAPCGLQEVYLKSILQLATPVGDICGHHLMVMLGDEITRQGFLKGVTIFDFNSTLAGYVLCDMVSRLEAWENNQNDWNCKDAKALVGYIPFFNLIPWLEDSRRTIDQGLQQARTYLQTVQPILTIAFSRSVATSAFSNFIHPWGLESTVDMVDVIGVPRVVSYAEDTYLSDDSMSGPPTGYSTIIIPHLHPGLDKHTMRLVDGPRKLMDLTWQISLCIAEIAMDFIKEHTKYTHTGQPVVIDREIAITTIMSQVSKGAALVPQRLQDLYTKLDIQKEAYKENERLAESEYPKSTLTQEEYQSSALLGAMARLLQFENVTGKPGSLERQKQTNRLWKMKMPVYHIGITRDDKDIWFEWLNSIPEGKNIHMSSMQLRSQQLCPYEGRTNALQKFASDGTAPGDHSWVNNPELKREAFSRWGKYAIKRRMEQDEDLFSSERQSKRGRLSALSRNQGVYVSTIQGSAITIAANGRTSLYWEDEENNQQKKLDINYCHIKPKSHKAIDLKGTIGFTEEGIVLTSDTQVNPPIVISLERLGSLEDNQDLHRLWVSERKKQGDLSSQRHLVVYSTPAGNLFPSVKTTSINIASIEIGDSLYILKRYCETIPPQTKYISMIPDDWKESYLKKKIVNNLVSNTSQVLFFQTSYLNYIQQNFSNHPRFGESLYKVNNFSDTNAGHSKQFLLLIQLLLKDTRPSTTIKFAFYHLKKSRAYQELQFL